MKNTLAKKLAILLAVMLIIPVAAIFCCCRGEVSANDIAPSHVHGATDADHSHDHADASKSSHGHSECNHDQIIGSLTQSSKILFVPNMEGFCFQAKPFLVSDAFNRLPFTASSPPLKTGPPGLGAFSTPLYLQISLLRI